MFTNQDLKKLIIPLFLEQLLVALVGIADVFVIGFVGGRPCEARKVRDDTSPSECDISHGSRPGTGNPLQAG